jgi:4-hydroxybenzoate polyprenyltransferase
VVEPRSAPPGAPRRREGLGLLLACHPAPATAVTLLAGLLAAAAGAGAAGVARVLAAFLAGQLSVGWSNDWLDASRDRLVSRRDKPVATGKVRRRTVGVATAVAATATVPLSFVLGPRAGAAHLVAVASAWSYNLWLKRTPWSWLPYAVSFGLLPNVVTLSLPRTHVAPWWTTAAGALLGVGAHLVNVLPDVDDDLATGVRGAVHRMGRRAAALVAPVVLVAATGLIAAGPPGPVSTPAWWALAAATVAAVVAAGSGTRARGRRLPLVATVVVAAVGVALLLASGGAL